MKTWVGYGLALLAFAVAAAWLSGYPGVAKYLLRWALPAFIVVALFLRGFYKG